MIKKILDMIRDKPHVAIGMPAILCSITFISNLVAALSDGVITSNEYHTLLSTADGFEAVVLFIVMLLLKDKDK